MTTTGAELPSRKGPTTIGIAIIALMILGIIAALIVIGFRGSPNEVTAALRSGDKKDYVGTWETKDRDLTADLKIDANGEISYNESSRLRASRGQNGNYEADFLSITSFEGDDILVGRDLRIKVTSRPHVVGDHMEMTANNLAFVRVK